MVPIAHRAATGPYRSRSAELLRRVLAELHRRARAVGADFGRASEQPLRKTSDFLDQAADTLEGSQRRITGGAPGREDDSLWAVTGRGPPESTSEIEDPALVVADELHRIHLSGARAMWTNFLPRFITNRRFEQWITARTEGPLPRLDAASGWNCWEMILWVAADKGVLTHAQIRKQYASILGRRAQRNRQQGFLPSGFPKQMRKTMLPHGTQDLDMSDPDGLRPGRGDLLVWHGLGEGNAHTAVATGRLIGPDRDPEVYSFWPPPTGPLVPGTVTAAVQITTVSALTPYADGAGVPAQPISYGRGPW
ncbi:hypothetical protein [Nocardia testacea]|uniref:hypothetical protein n=1 Tax=Nocardia testacea TaxID=248551 RepID=UPI0033E99028